MFEGLSQAEISEALSELVEAVGIGEDAPYDDLIALLREKDVQGCVQEMATRFGLPIRVNLSFVPPNFTTHGSGRFRSSAVVQTDWGGRGVGHIIAQVVMPEQVPLLGTTSLRDYPFTVMVSEECHSHPESFLATMAHELSHVLLATMWHPKRTSELHADLLPLLLGYRELMQTGRKAVRSITFCGMTTTQTTTYGYLTDSQVDFACVRVADILDRLRGRKRNLIRAARELHDGLERARRGVAAYRDYFGYLDSHPPAKMGAEDARRIVELHSKDWSREWEARIASLGKRQQAAVSFGTGLSHYPRRAESVFEALAQDLHVANGELHQMSAAITKDVRLLRRYVGVVFRFRRLFRRGK